MVVSRSIPPSGRRSVGPSRLLLLLLVAATASGCVRRRLTVRSQPAGAIVHVDNQRIGTTPCAVDYVYYGTREIRLTLPGYETLTVNQPLPAPWYQLPGIDFISENLVPTRIEDARTVSFNLEPSRLMAPEEVIARGEELRRQVTPLGAAPVVPAGATFPMPGQPAFGAAPPRDASAVASRPSPAFPRPPAIPQAAQPMTVVTPQPAPPAPGLPDTFR